MTNRVLSITILVLAASAALLFTSPASDAADWPMWRHDAGRSAATDEQLPAELHLHWSRQLRSSLLAAMPCVVRSDLST